MFSQEILEKDFQKFSQSFLKYYPKIRVDYSVKTNYELAILKILKKIRSSLEISCGHELFLALKAGFKPGQIIFDGPAKKKEDIVFALRKEIHAFYIDSQDDLRIIARLAETHSQKVKVVFRISLGIRSILPHPAEAFINKFGIPKNEFLPIIHLCQKNKNIQIIGLGVHLGSQMTTPSLYLKAIDELEEIIAKLKNLNLEASEISLGGGFPAASLKKTNILGLFLSGFGLNLKTKNSSIEDFAKQIGSKFRKMTLNLKINPVLAFQPGRLVTSRMGIVVCRILSIKNKWIFLDISNSSLPESLYFAQRSILLAEKLGQKKIDRFNIAGCGLSAADNLGLAVFLPKPQIGDLVVVQDAGAYSVSRASHFSSLIPPVYLIDKNKKLKLIRRKEKFQDVSRQMQS